MKRGCLAWQPTVERQSEKAKPYAPALLQNEPNQYFDIVSLAQYVQERRKQGLKVTSPTTGREMTARDQYDLLKMAQQIANHKELFSEQYYETQLNDQAVFDADDALPNNMLPDDYNDPFTELTESNIPGDLAASAYRQLDPVWDAPDAFRHILVFEAIIINEYPVALPSPLDLQSLLKFLALSEVPNIPAGVMDSALRQLQRKLGLAQTPEDKPVDLNLVMRLSAEAEAHVVAVAQHFVGGLLAPLEHEHGLLTTRKHQKRAIRYVLAQKVSLALKTLINERMRAMAPPRS